MFFLKLSNAVAPSKFRQMFPIIAGLWNSIRYIVPQLLLVSVMVREDKSYTLGRCHCRVIMVQIKFQLPPTRRFQRSGRAL